MQSDYRIELEQKRRALCRLLVQHFFQGTFSNDAQDVPWQLLAQPTKSDVPVTGSSKFQPVVEKLLLLCKHQESRHFDEDKVFTSITGVAEKLRFNSLLKKSVSLHSLTEYVKLQTPRFETEAKENFTASILHTLLLLGGSPTRVTWDPAELVSTKVDIPGVRSAIDDQDNGSEGSDGDSFHDSGLDDWENEFDETSDEEEVFREEVRHSEALIDSFVESPGKQDTSHEQTGSEGAVLSDDESSDGAAVTLNGAVPQTPTLQKLFLAITPGGTETDLDRAVKAANIHREHSRSKVSRGDNDPAVLPPSILFEKATIPSNSWPRISATSKWKQSRSQCLSERTVQNVDNVTDSDASGDDADDSSSASESSTKAGARGLSCEDGAAGTLLNLDTCRPNSLLSTFAVVGVDRATDLPVASQWIVAPERSTRYEVALSWSVVRALRGASGDLFDKTPSPGCINSRCQCTRDELCEPEALCPVAWDGYRLALGDTACRLTLCRHAREVQVLHLSPRALRNILLDFGASAEALQRLRAVAGLVDKSSSQTPQSNEAGPHVRVAVPRTLQALAACCQAVVATFEDTLLGYERALLDLFRGNGARGHVFAAKTTPTLVQLAGYLHRDCEIVKRFCVVIGRCLHEATDYAESRVDSHSESQRQYRANYNAMLSGQLLSSLFAVVRHACMTGVHETPSHDSPSQSPASSPHLAPLNELLLNVFLSMVKAFLRVLSGWLYQGVVFDEARELFIQAVHMTGAGGNHVSLHVPAPIAMAGVPRSNSTIGQDDFEAGIESGHKIGNYAYTHVDWSHASVRYVDDAVPSFFRGEVSSALEVRLKKCMA